MIWAHLKSGGVLFLNQTPHRYFPVEHHTTNLPMINYFPDTDTLLVTFSSGKVVDTRDLNEDILIELDEKGRRLVVLRPSRQVRDLLGIVGIIDALDVREA